jgi:SAM-dependent methyltransferase
MPLTAPQSHAHCDERRSRIAPPMGRDLYAHPPSAPDRAGARLSRRALLGLRMSGLAERDVDYDAAAQRARAVWERTGHEPLLRAIEPAADVVATLADPVPGARILDVGAGDGNAALACARRGAAVSACDPSGEMVRLGRARCGDRVEWRIGDAAELPYADASFDAAVSAFGAALAPDAGRAARELVRVVRPGGLVVLAAWVPRGLPGGLDEYVERIAPLPHGVPSPREWGVESVCRERLRPLLDELELRTRTIALRFDDADTAFAALAGATPLRQEERAQVRRYFDRLLAAANESRSAIEIRARYLVARGRVPG